jgi:hypothetical protein
MRKLPIKKAGQTHFCKDIENLDRGEAPANDRYFWSPS